MLTSLLLASVIAQTPIPMEGSEPDWNRDGSKIAFRGEGSDGKTGLWTMNGDGTDVRLVVPDAAGKYYLHWFPDESRLSYVEQAGNEMVMYSVKPDGSDRKVFLPSNAPKSELCPVEWSIDGKLVAYGSKLKPDANESVVLVDVATGNVVASIEGDRSYDPKFSPDGKHILYNSKGGLFLADANLQNRKMIVEGTQKEFALDATWSPDGRHILYAFNRPQGRELWTANPDGTERHLLYNSPVRFFYPVWSPKGDRIVMAVKQTDNDQWLYTIDPEGKNKTRMLGVDPGAPIWDLFGDYKIEGQAWGKDGKAQPQTGVALFSRPLDGILVRETFTIYPRGRPIGGEISLSRTSPTTYEASWLNDWNGEQRAFAGSWDAANRKLTFDRVLPAAGATPSARDAMRLVYAFEGSGFVRETFVGETKVSELKYSKN